MEVATQSKLILDRDSQYFKIVKNFLMCQVTFVEECPHKISREILNVSKLSTFGCGVAHTVAHTTPVREDLGSILHTTQDGIFRENSHLPSFRQQT
jgi:hypothetical protein